MAMNLSGEEKAAILLRAIGEDAAAEVMRHLDPKDIRKIGSHMTAISNISRDEESTVIAEFQTAASIGDVGFEGKEYIKSVLTKALGSDKAERILETLTNTSYPGLESLKWLDPKTVAQMIKVEHPQTIAVILAHLDPDQASQILTHLPDFMQADVTLRLGTIEEIQPEVLQHLSEVLQEAFKGGSKTRGCSVGGTKVVAEIMGRLDKAMEGNIMGKLAEKDPDLAESIRSLMFVFDDLVKVEDRGLQELMKEISKEELPVALRGAGQPVREKFLKNMSSRAAETLREDMEARGPVKVSEVEKAQQNILKLCRKLEAEGRLVIAGQGEEMV
ncbi:MAG: flagellar motor switch protein FliG [Nitrospirota bacterium]|nr:flagellar motor switch protein FliG [Nitrospirota bacterium]MDE3118064.1 flagellar motor switch protein FliG [Nitrospirota bacterium]MDE3243050.1 flagellar motor switch protein FliG [Nitrospirota bacterium]